MSDTKNAALIIAILLSPLFSGCTTPKVIEHHHHYEADTLAMQAQTDSRLSDTRAVLDSLTSTLIEDYRASWFSHDDQRERITETVTTLTDSLGRQIRTEQRTTERTLSRQQQQSEQRLSQEFEQRISVVVDSLNDIWQQRFNAVKGHWEQTDSTNSHVQSGSAAFGELPWYKRWWQTLKDYLLMAGIVLLIIATRRIWWPWCKKLFRIS